MENKSRLIGADSVIPSDGYCGRGTAQLSYRCPHLTISHQTLEATFVSSRLLACQPPPRPPSQPFPPLPFQQSHR